MIEKLELLTKQAIPFLPDFFAVIIAILPLTGSFLSRVFGSGETVSGDYEKMLNYIILGQATLLAPIPSIIKAAIFMCTVSVAYLLPFFCLLGIYIGFLIMLVRTGYLRFYGMSKFARGCISLYPLLVAVLSLFLSWIYAPR